MSLFADPRNSDEKACHNLLSASWSAQLLVRPHNHVQIPSYSLASPAVMDYIPLNHEPERPFFLYVALAKCFTTAVRKVAKILDNSIIKSSNSSSPTLCSSESLLWRLTVYSHREGMLSLHRKYSQSSGSAQHTYTQLTHSYAHFIRNKWHTFREFCRLDPFRNLKDSSLNLACGGSPLPLNIM